MIRKFEVEKDSKGFSLAHMVLKNEDESVAVHFGFYAPDEEIERNAFSFSGLLAKGFGRP